MTNRSSDWAGSTSDRVGQRQETTGSLCGADWMNLGWARQCGDRITLGVRCRQLSARPTEPWRELCRGVVEDRPMRQWDDLGGRFEELDLVGGKDKSDWEKERTQPCE